MLPTLSVRSSLSPEVCALSSKIAKCAPPSIHAITTLMGIFQRTKANEQTIESLALRVKALAELLCAPVSEGDVKERGRRKNLER